ncbi:olfactory receptor 4D2-like [Salvelinus namaycush]|uniref:Olfactory receptor 4D2-like n=1 Tax=Salvelinus namaycush TaxID=8040 RepID=A0A8U0P2Y5_SALNM|nr:olfactory receptor 4D2-like [Salvelinus namaycush]
MLANVANICFILHDKRLHKPMYLLICNLAVVDMLYSSSASPTMIGVLVAGDKTIAYVSCFIQMFVFHLGGVMEMFAISVMAFDRLIAISSPLRYQSILTNVRTLVLTVLTRLGVVLTLEERHGLMIGAILGPSLVNPFVYCFRTKEIKNKMLKMFNKVAPTE